MEEPITTFPLTHAYTINKREFEIQALASHKKVSCEVYIHFSFL
jgi:hypothetical protein